MFKRFGMFADFAVLRVFNVVDVAGFPCWMVLRNVECVKVEEASFNRCASHFLKTQLNQFCSDFIEKLQVRMFFSRPSFCHRSFYVVFLEFCRLPFTRDYKFRGELGDFLGGNDDFGCCFFAFCGDLESTCGFGFNC